jgi:hypothetical protein
VIGRLIELEWEFWQRVEAQDPPAPTEADAHLLGDVWTPAPDSVVVLDRRGDRSARPREQAKADEKAAKARAAEAEAVIKLALGDHEFGARPDGTPVCSWKQMPAVEVKATTRAAHRRFNVLKPKEA